MVTESQVTLKRVGVFVDVSNLYYCLGNKLKNSKLDYSKLLEYIQDFGKIIIKYAYGAQLNSQAEVFIKRLQELGFTTFFKEPKTYAGTKHIRRKADWDVAIALDIMDLSNQLDIIVLCSADGDMVPLVKRLLDKDKQVIIIAATISKDLRDITTTIEIPESFLEKKRGRKFEEN